MTDRYVGGLQPFSCSSGKVKDEVNYNCENCNALTTRICGRCSKPYCSKVCLNNSVLDHKNSCSKGSKTSSKESLSSKENSYQSSSDSSSEESSSIFDCGNFESGSTVIISTFCTLQTVFIRKVDNVSSEYFIKLCNDVALSAMKEEELPTPPQIDDLCSARYYEDLCYYRAKICSFENDEATVIFIDYGNSQITKVKDLRVLPENLRSAPELAIKVELKNVPKGSSLQAVNYFNKLTAERIPLILEYDDISEGVILTEEETRQVVNEKVANYALPSWKKDESVMSKLGEVFFMESLKLQSLEVGKKYNLCLSHFFEKEFVDSGVFWATHVEIDEFFHVNGEMKERIAEYCEYLKDDCYLPRVNELCLAKEKGEWFRCVNLKCHKTSCFLFFVDDGHSSIIETVNIRKIIKDFIEVPGQAICCILSDDSKLKADTELQKKISDKLKTAVHQIIEDVQIDKFLGDVYCVSLPKITEVFS